MFVLSFSIYWNFIILFQESKTSILKIILINYYYISIYKIFIKNKWIDLIWLELWKKFLEKKKKSREINKFYCANYTINIKNNEEEDGDKILLFAFSNSFFFTAFSLMLEYSSS